MICASMPLFKGTGLDKDVVGLIIRPLMDSWIGSQIDLWRLKFFGSIGFRSLLSEFYRHTANLHASLTLYSSDCRTKIYRSRFGNWEVCYDDVKHACIDKKNRTRVLIDLPNKRARICL